MILSLTYAQYAALIIASLGLPSSPVDQDAMVNTRVTVGWNVKSDAEVGKKGILTFEKLLPNNLLYGIRPLLAVGFSVDGMGYASAGVRKDFIFDKIRVSPYFAPSMYSANMRYPTVSELIQFKSGVDVAYQVKQNTYVGVGIYHMSNAQITKDSAGVDVYHASISWK